VLNRTDFCYELTKLICWTQICHKEKHISSVRRRMEAGAAGRGQVAVY
jgi:hypothetical protein